MTPLAHPALAHDALLPRSPGGQGPGAALSMVVHLGLIAALTTSVDWRAQTPEVFSAEIWASVPQAAAPAPVEAPPPAPTPAPPPAPEPSPLPRTAAPTPTPDADIAIERDRKRKAEVAQRELDERKKIEAERKQAEADSKRAAAEKKRAEQQERDAKAEDERLARQREENLKRMMGQAGGTGTATAGAGTATAGTGTGTAAQSAGPSADYAGKVIAAVRPNIKFPGDVPGNATTEVEVRAAAGGSIISSRIVKKSGHDDWDAAVLRAIDRTGALPRDNDGRVPTTIVIVFRRE